MMVFDSGLPPEPARAADELQPQEGDLEVRRFIFQDGERLPLLRLHYTALGTPQRDAAGIADNPDLSTRAAATIATFLRSQGVNPNILSAKGFGATHPVAPNDTPQGRAQNRRIEIILEGTCA